MENDSSETWKPVVGYEGFYEVSDHGRVRSLDRDVTGPSGRVRHRRGKLMRINEHKHNYPMVQLCRNGSVKGMTIHRLVAMAHIGVPDNADQLHVCHFDGNRLNNHVSNLRWDTPTGNYADMKRHGRANWHSAEFHPYPVCKRGHEMTGDNVRSVGSLAKRQCVACANLRRRVADARARIAWIEGDLERAREELRVAQEAMAA